MKQKEKQHLKDDPFIDFIEKVLHQIGIYKKHIIIGVISIIGLIIVSILIAFLVKSGYTKDNKLFAEALNVHSSENLSIDQKINDLQKIKSKSGLSNANLQLLAALYIEKGQFDEASTVEKEMKDSGIELLDNNAVLIKIAVLAGQNKNSEALTIIDDLLKKNTPLPAKDYLLFRKAQLQIAEKQMDEAKKTLEKLETDHPQSGFSMEARNLKEKIS
jgi:tetratricopeptide (TPR) repeat protein